MRLLLVEDDPAIAQTLAYTLGALGHRVEVATRADQAVGQGLASAFDVIILDRSLPDGDGLDVLLQWRERGLSTPVVVLTARMLLEERLAGLKAGADDYLGKPFDLDELVLRLEALHRRAAGRGAGPELGGGVHLDPWRRVLQSPRGDVGLTAREFGLLAELAGHAGDVLTRSHLLQRVWGDAFDGLPNVIDVYVGYLRTKLARAGATAAIVTVRGAGYRLAAAGG